MATDRILQRLDSLINMGEKVLSTRHPPPRGVITHDYVEEALFYQWRTSSLAFLRATFEPDSVHSHDFDTNCQKALYYEANRGVAVLRSAKEDIEGGYLQKVESLVSAEVFSDFLEMARHLLDNDYKDPAASLIGAVLEDSLRRICRNDNITVKPDDNISSLNKKLADKDVYNRLRQREIEVWNKLRDYADHGYFGEYKADDVKNMLAEVGNFLTNYLK